MLDYKQIYETEHVQNGLSYSEIRKKYNIPRGTWDYHVRKKLGLSCDQRKYKAVDNFFDTIDCEIKSYLLGFLYADYSLRFETAYGSYYLASKLYKNANYYLQRKYNKALQIIKYRTNTELTGNRKTFPEV